MRTEYRALLLE